MVLDFSLGFLLVVFAVLLMLVVGCFRWICCIVVLCSLDVWGLLLFDIVCGGLLMRLTLVA